MRVVFVSDHFSTPDQPGILRTWQLSKYLCEAGDEVVVIAPDTHYLFSQAVPRSTPLPDRLTLVSLRSQQLNRASMSSRLRYYWSQLIGATVEVWKAGRTDIVVAGQTPSLLSFGPFLVARMRKVPFVLDERDLALDAASELGLLPAPVLALARKAETFLHRGADAVLAVTPGLQRVLEQRGVPTERLWLLPNGFDAVSDGKIASREQMRNQLGWGDKVVLLYAGGLGRAYDLDLVLDALATLQSEKLLLVVLGDGEQKAAYRLRAVTEGLPVQFMEPLPKSEVVAICRGADIGMVPLTPVARSSYVLSNKLFDYLGAGLPVIVTGQGDTADLLLEAGAGTVVPGRDATAMAQAIAALADDADARVRMGTAGQRFVDSNWRREQFAASFRQALEVLVAGHQRSRKASLSESERIGKVYRSYDSKPREQAKRSISNPGVRAMAEGRWAAIRGLLETFPSVDNPKILDVGCGGGVDLSRIGELWKRRSPVLHGVDLLPDRIARAHALVPSAALAIASGDRLPFPDRYFDVVLVSTLFSSILDVSLRRSVAQELLRVVDSAGAVICYDVRMPNPANPNTRAITTRELARLFPAAEIVVRSTTVLPPLARRLRGRTAVSYSLLHCAAFLRSHNLAVVRRAKQDVGDMVGATTGTVPCASDQHGGKSGGRPILFVANAEHRFANMTVNQRLGAAIRAAPVDVLSCYPTSFPEDTKARIRIISFPLSRRAKGSVAKLLLFTMEVLVWALVRGQSRNYSLVYSFQDTSAAVGWLLQSRKTGWVVDAVDDPAMDLSNALERRRRFKSLALRLRDSLMHFLLPRADLVCTIGWTTTDPLPTLLCDSYSVEKSRVLPLNQAIDVAAVASGRQWSPPQRPQALFVGFVSPLRGVDTLLHAGEMLRGDGLDFEIRLIGHLQAPDREWLADFMRRNPGLVCFDGVLPSDHTLDAMATATVGVLPFLDRREMRPAQPVTGLEYLALGTPMVGTKLPGMATLIEDGVNGFLVEVGDAKGMAEALRRIMTDPQLAQGMGRSSRARAPIFDVSLVNDRLGEALSKWT